MIGYLEGEITAVADTAVLLLTSSGVGYELHLPLPQLPRAAKPGARVGFHVVTIVREDEISLYGFEDMAGKRLFRALIGVSGIGPKVAMAMLSAMAPRQLAGAIVRQDVALLATVPGIGKKTASRLCIELSDRLAGEILDSGQPSDSRSDLISALTNLGFPEKDVLTILQQIPVDLPSFSDQLKRALALLGKNKSPGERNSL